MAVLNPRFEEPGEHPGQAEHWTLATHVAGERVAGFGPEPWRGVEGFERWVEWKGAFEDGDLVLSFFDFAPEGFEDFGEGWANDVYLHDLPTGHVAACPFDGEDVEHMEAGWLAAPFAWEWGDVTSGHAEFDGEPAEGFEQEWRENQDYTRDWSEVPAAQAFFNITGDDAESFEVEWPLASTI